ncbi:hypothetical protein EDB86DRAFT_2836305 [Lactarius hatsudake]|nr:hypothetical protein EDB86DRAFT_2836305 [Lactarius hatsudake]
MAKYEFWFFVEGKDLYHKIIISEGKDVADLKTRIHEEGRHSYWIGVDAIELVLFQVDIDPTPHRGKIRELRAPDDARVMDEPMDRIQQLWPDEPTKDHLHICVRLPSAIGKRRAEDETERGKPSKLVRTELHESDTSGFSRIPSHKVQSAWELYTNMWGQPLKDVVLTVHGQQNVLEYVPSEKLQGWLTIVPYTGLGKTSFLYYVLLRRLSSKSPTAFQLPDGCILFDEGGPQEFSRFPKHTVAFADSTTTGMEPPCVAFQDAAKAYVRVIQTTSPALDNSKGWYKEVSANQYVMDYSSSEEMDVFGKILDLNCDVLQRIYNTWGPFDAQLCGVYAGDVESAVRDFVKKFQHSPTYINPFAESHKIISVRPKEVGPRDEGRSRLTARVATRRIERMILLYSIKAEVAEQISFYKMLSTHKWFGSSPTGYTLRTYVLACLSAHPASKPLPCIAADSGPSTLEIPVSLRERSFSLDSAASLKDVNNHTVPFCLIPTSSNFVAFDAIVCSQDYFFTIQKPKNLPAEVIICSAVIEIDRLGSIHERLVEMSKEKSCARTIEDLLSSEDEAYEASMRPRVFRRPDSRVSAGDISIRPVRDMRGREKLDAKVLGFFPGKFVRTKLEYLARWLDLTFSLEFFIAVTGTWLDINELVLVGGESRQATRRRCGSAEIGIEIRLKVIATWQLVRGPKTCRHETQAMGSVHVWIICGPILSNLDPP